MINRKTKLNQPVDNGWMPKGTEAWWATATEHQSGIDFVSHRLSKDSEAVRELGQCRSWKDASGVNSKWLHDTFNDYSTEATKVMAINVKAADAAQHSWPRF